MIHRLKLSDPWYYTELGLVRMKSRVGKKLSD